MCFMFHVSLLEFHHTSTIPRRIHDPLHLLKLIVNMNMKWGDILNSRISNRQLQYFVHWHGYDVNERTWELIKNLSNAMDKVCGFHR